LSKARELLPHSEIWQAFGTSDDPKPSPLYV
jgi:hypothetical protein